MGDADDGQGGRPSLGSARHYAPGSIVRDIADPESKLRGLVVRGPLSWCGYVGVPVGHPMEGLDELKFDCHWSVNYSAYGDDEPLPSGFYWWGWDYAHGTDATFAEGELGELMDAFFASRPAGRRPKKDWQLEEVASDVVDAMVELRTAILASQKLSALLTRSVGGRSG